MVHHTHNKGAGELLTCETDGEQLRFTLWEREGENKHVEAVNVRQKSK